MISVVRFSLRRRSLPSSSPLSFSSCSHTFVFVVRCVESIILRGLPGQAGLPDFTLAGKEEGRLIPTNLRGGLSPTCLDSGAVDPSVSWTPFGVSLELQTCFLFLLLLDDTPGSLVLDSKKPPLMQPLTR